MKTWTLYFVSIVLPLLPQFAFSASNELATALQKGLFEEEANHNYPAAIAAYQSAIAQFDDARDLAATAVFRLGDVYSKLGKTNDANAQYQRILREFPDQSVFTSLSQSYLGAAPKVEGASATTNAAAESSLAAEEQEIRRWQKLIADSPDLLNAGDPGSGQTPLHKAAAKGELIAAQFLLTNSANVNARDRTEGTPLYEATAANHKEMVDLLLRAGADPNCTGGELHYTPLHVAAERARKPIVEALLAGGANPNARNYLGVTPLHLAVASGFKTIVEVLLAHGADPVARIESSFNSAGGPISGSSLEIAISRGYPAIAEMLLNNRADPNQKRFFSGQTMLSLAASHGSRDIAEMLLDHGANASGLNDTRETPLMSAAQKSDAELVKLLLSHKADVKAKDSGGRTALHHLISNGSQRTSASEVADLLLNAGADVNALDLAAQTPLGRLIAGDQAGPTRPGRLRVAAPQPLSEDQSKLAALLSKHGGMAEMPDFSGARLSRSGLQQPVLTLFRDTNGLNRFTILELLANYFEHLRPMSAGGFSPQPLGIIYSKQKLPFPDPSWIRIVRPVKGGKEKEEIPVNLLKSDNSFDCTKDTMLQFGDVVEIPEREHALSESAAGLTGAQLASLGPCIRRKVTFIIKGQSVDLTLLGHSQDTYLSAAMGYPEVQNRLRTSSDLTTVKIIRTDSATKEKKEITENILPFWKNEKPLRRICGCETGM